MHLGRLIKEVFDAEPKDHNIKWFAASLNCDRRNIYHIFERENLDVELLKRISLILRHDFFADISRTLDFEGAEDGVK